MTPYTPSQLDKQATRWAPDDHFETAAMLRQAAAQARVLAGMREWLEGERDTRWQASAIESSAGFELEQSVARRATAARALAELDRLTAGKEQG